MMVTLRVQKTFLSVAFLLWPMIAMADDLSLLQLHEICDSTDDRSKSACSGLLVGFVAGLQIGSAAAKQGKPICLPENFSPDQLKAVLDKLVRDVPQFLHLPAVPGLAVPLQTAYPCSRSKQDGR
jgi:Rap1a immunity proteins